MLNIILYIIIQLSKVNKIFIKLSISIKINIICASEVNCILFTVITKQLHVLVCESGHYWYNIKYQYTLSK